MVWHPPPFSHWLISFLKTLVVEIPIYVFFARRTVPWRRAALAALVCTVVTHPALWYLWPHVTDDFRVYIITGEVIVALVESVVFYFLARPIRFSLALSASFIANAASYGFWALIKHLF